MKLNLNQELYTLKGEILKNEKREVLSLKDVLLNITFMDIEKEENKLLNFKLGLRINQAETEVELSVDEVATIQKKLSKTYNTLVVGQVHEILEGRENPLKPVKTEENESK